MISRVVSREWGFAALFCRMGELGAEFVCRACAGNEAATCVGNGMEGGTGGEGRDREKRESGSKGRGREQKQTDREAGS